MFFTERLLVITDTSTEGAELLLPEYDPPDNESRLKPSKSPDGRVSEMVEAITVADPAADLHGAFVAGWGDMGLHPETFWHGYVCGVAAAVSSRQAICSCLPNCGSVLIDCL